MSIILLFVKVNSGIFFGKKILLLRFTDNRGKSAQHISQSVSARKVSRAGTVDRSSVDVQCGQRHVCITMDACTSHFSGEGGSENFGRLTPPTLSFPESLCASLSSVRPYAHRTATVRLACGSIRTGYLYPDSRVDATILLVHGHSENSNRSFVSAQIWA
jgi:hypothetical protein